MKVRNVYCEHYTGEGLLVNLEKMCIWLCPICDKKCREIIIEQIKLEREAFGKSRYE